MELVLGFLANLFGGKQSRAGLEPLYRAVVAIAREPRWYQAGAVPDTVDGRFDMVAAVLSLVLIRLEREPEQTRTPSLLLTEIFIDDMEGSLRQSGVGDLMVGKHVGKMMGALGGRLAAFRTAIAEADFDPAVRRNIFHDAPPTEAALRFVADGLARLSARLQSMPAATILNGELAA